jgi:hypothetical protein
VLAVDCVTDAGNAVGAWGQVNKASHLITWSKAAGLKEIAGTETEGLQDTR